MADSTGYTRPPRPLYSLHTDQWVHANREWRCSVAPPGGRARPGGAPLGASTSSPCSFVRRVSVWPRLCREAPWLVGLLRRASLSLATPAPQAVQYLHHHQNECGRCNSQYTHVHAHVHVRVHVHAMRMCMSHVMSHVMLHVMCMAWHATVALHVLRVAMRFAT